MNEFNDHETTIYGSYGEFESYGLPQTDEEWAAYDAAMAEEMAMFDAEIEASWGQFIPDESDIQAPF